MVLPVLSSPEQVAQISNLSHVRTNLATTFAYRHSDFFYQRGQMLAINEFLAAKDSQGQGDEFYRRNRELLDVLNTGKEWQKEEWREFCVGLEIDFQLKALAIDNPFRSREAQIGFLLDELKNPDSSVILRQEQELKRLSRLRLLAVSPERIDRTEPITQEERSFIDFHSRRCHGDWMTQGRVNARGTIEEPEHLTAYLEELKRMVKKGDEINWVLINPEGQSLKDAYQVLGDDSEFVERLNRASYTPSDRLATEEEIRQAQEAVAQEILSSPAKRAAEIIHAGIVAEAAWNVVTNRLEKDAQRPINPQVAAELASHQEEWKNIFTHPLYSTEAALAEYQSLERLKTLRTIHLLQRLKELSTNPQAQNVLEKEITKLENRANQQLLLIKALRESAASSAEALLAPVVRRGQRELRIQKRVKGILEGRKSSSSRIKRELKELSGFFKTSEGKKFLSLVDNPEFLQAMQDKARRNNKALRGKKEEREGRKRIVYKTLESQFFHQVKKWLPTIITSRYIHSIIADVQEKGDVSPNLQKLSTIVSSLSGLQLFSEEKRVALEAMLEGRVVARIGKMAKKAKERLESLESLRASTSLPMLDIGTIQGFAKIELREALKSEPWPFGHDLNTEVSPRWEEEKLGPIRLPEAIKELPIDEVRSDIPLASSVPEFRLVQVLETASSEARVLDEVVLRERFFKLQETIEQAIPLLVNQSVHNRDITLADTKEGWQKIVYKNSKDNRIITIVYDHRGGKTELKFFQCETFPIGKEKIGKVGEPAFHFTLDLRGKEIKIVSDYEADPNREYSREEITMALSQWAIGEKVSGNSIPLTKVKVRELRRNAHKRGTPREWHYSSHELKVDDSVHKVIRSEFVPPQPRGGIDLSQMLGSYTEYLESVLPKTEEPIGLASALETPAWRTLLPFLAEISYWRRDYHNHNPSIESFLITFFEERRKEVGEALARGNIALLLEKEIRQFENLARNAYPVALALELSRYVNTEDHVALKNDDLVRIWEKIFLGNLGDDELLPFLNQWYRITAIYEVLSFEQAQGRLVADDNLQRQIRRLEMHPLVGAVKKNLKDLVASKDELKRLMAEIPPEQRFLVNREWVEVLKMMDYMDEKEENPNFGYPHLVMVNWYNFHLPSQNIGLPFPEGDGLLSSSPFFQQIEGSARWVRRLAHEINPQDILAFPKVKGNVNWQNMNELTNDPEWGEILQEVSILLERKRIKKNIETDTITEDTITEDDTLLDFTLTEENYQKLDTPRKKLAAFLLLRARVSSFVGAVMGMFFQLKDVQDYDDFPKLAQIAFQRNVLRPIDERLIFSPVNDNQSFIAWFNEIFHDPLLTSTRYAFVKGKNHIRERFIQKAEEILQVTSARNQGSSQVANV